MSDEIPVRPPTSSLRIVATLAVAGMLSGTLLVLVHQATQPRILAHKAEALRQAVGTVLQQPTTTQLLYRVDERLTAELPEGASERDFAQVHAGFDADGALVGFAIAHSKAGFQDQVRVLFGWNPRSERLLGMKVLESRETPGLGDKIEKDLDFVGQFGSASTPLLGVKAGAGSGAQQEIHMITGATISSRVVIEVINEAAADWAPLLEAWIAEAIGA